ncbi:membrane assembly protein AsmA [Methylacidiphilum caldifontis]|uniref:Membrane assembly protein AsmA n=2 Tax=Methylacidiphilum caldifontis TaxID=2795386 RepID=A0A4Y8P950_9BACT|nr:membrane assembly protein AsmA [Methylacidiphilum caldifontis]
MRLIVKLIEALLLVITTLFLLYLCFFFVLQNMEKKQATIHFIQSALTDLLGVPVDVEKIHFSFPLGINLEKLKVENSLSKSCPSLFECNSIKLKSHISPFLYGLYLNVLLTEPKTSFELNSGRRLLLPLIEEGSNGEELPSLFSGKLAASLPIRKISIQKGIIKIFSAHQQPLLMIEGIDEEEELDLRNQKTLSRGQAKRVFFNSTPFLYNLKFKYLFSSKVFQNFDLDSQLSGGKLHLDLYNQANQKDKKKTLGWKISASGLKAQEIFELLEAHGYSSISGLLHCNAEGSIHGMGLDSFEGKGTFEIERGKFENMALFDKLSNLLKNASMKTPEFDQWKGSFIIKEGKILFTDMSLSSNSFSMVGSGLVKFNSSMEMDLKILLNKPFFKANLPESLLSRIKMPQNSVFSVPVKISGTLSNPQVAFIETHSMPQLSPSGSTLLSPLPIPAK